MFESLEAALALLVLAGALAVMFTGKVNTGTRALSALNIILSLLWFFLGARAAALTLLVLGGLVIPLLFRLGDASASEEARR